MTTTVNLARSRTPRTRGRLLSWAVGGLLGILVLGYVAYSGAYLVSNIDWNAERAFADGFESGDLSAWQVGDTELCCEHSASVVAGEARDGSKALRLHLRDSDPRVAGSKRAELRLQAVPIGAERWYGFSLLVPRNWPATPDLVTVAQWHAVDDRIFGEGGRAPPLRLIIKDGNWALSSQWDRRLLSGMPFMRASPQDGDLLWTGPFQRGVWTDWVFRVRWSYGDDGIVEIWKDGQLVAKRTGPNAYNDLLGPFFKLGIYIPQWNSSGTQGRERTLLIDRVRQDTRPLVSGESTSPPASAPN